MSLADLQRAGRFDRMTARRMAPRNLDKVLAQPAHHPGQKMRIEAAPRQIDLSLQWKSSGPSNQ